MIEVNTSTEYWQKGASLVHTDPAGREDAALPAGVRVYMIAGTQHGGGPGTDPSPGPCVNPRNPHSASPALRALLVALEEWVTRRRRAARQPRCRASPTAPLVEADSVGMPAVPGFATPPGVNRIAAPVDWVDPPARLDNFYGARVSAVDADGNEIAGIRLPPIAVPLGTYTGWNVYRAQPCELCDRDGSLIPFARTRERARGGRRPAPLARRALRQPRRLMSQRSGRRRPMLVAERLLLPSDAEAYVRKAESCDWF